MKLHNVLEATHHTSAIGPVKLWRVKVEGPGRSRGEFYDKGYIEDDDVYIHSSDSYTDEDCTKCDGDGEDDEGEECEYCYGSGQFEWDDFGDQWEVGYVIGTKENVDNAFYYEEMDIDMEGKDAWMQFSHSDEIPQHLIDGMYRP